MFGGRIDLRILETFAERLLDRLAQALAQLEKKA